MSLGYLSLADHLGSSLCFTDDYLDVVVLPYAPLAAPPFAGIASLRRRLALSCGALRAAVVVAAARLFNQRPLVVAVPNNVGCGRRLGRDSHVGAAMKL